MKYRCRLLAVAILTCGLLAGCQENKAQQIAEGKIFPLCTAPVDLPNTAMGRLGIRLIPLGDQLRVIIPTDPVFDLRSSDIQDSAYPALQQLARTLAPYRNLPLRISGYTDELGTAEEDQILGEQQARAIQTFLWTQGFDHQCLVPVGIGKSASGQVASNRSPLGSMANRRVEITLAENACQ